ncbi:hypothetical protein [Aeromicrobium sp. Leaf350]|uniref:hypothetical protein n=1 Tax=Aeromicrobium sp. Leaf350 TaxID=2876565 RepID=UPI001E3F9E15|nr:hypothetical protein [Aeromicrobium sp. Leaf350]
MSTPARLFALVSSVLTMLVVAPAAAMADTPITWEQEEGLGWLGYSVLLVGIPVGLIVVIWVLTSLLSRNNYVPPAPGNEVHVSTGDVDHH